MFLLDTCNAVPAREDRKPKYWRLGRRHFGLSLTLWRHTVKHDILNMACDCWFPCCCVYWSLVKARKIVWESQVIDSSSITQAEALWVWHCDVTTSNSIQGQGRIQGFSWPVCSVDVVPYTIIWIWNTIRFFGVSLIEVVLDRVCVAHAVPLI